MRKQDKRCGTCSGCAAAPQRPCVLWIRIAIRRLKKELESPGFARVLQEWKPAEAGKGERDA